MFTRNACFATLTALAALTPSLSQAIEIEQRSLSSDSVVVPSNGTVSGPAASSGSSVISAATPLPATPAKTASAPAQAAAASTTANGITAVAKPVAAAAAPVNPAWDMFQQLESLQNTVARLQGQVEEQQQTISQMRDDLRVRYSDLDQRVDLLTQRAGGGDAAAAGAAAGAGAATAAGATGSTASAGNTPVPIVDPAAKAATTATGSATNAAAASAAASQAVAASNDPEQQKQAYLAALKKRSEGMPTAIAAMDAFAKQYPNGTYTPNAYYWIGEYQLASDPPNLQAGEASFNRVIHDFPDSSKVPGAIYKLGTIADLRDDRTEARRQMSDVVKKFPKTPEAGLAKSYLADNPAIVAPTSRKR